MTYFECIISRSRKRILADKAAGEVDGQDEVLGSGDVCESNEVFEASEICEAGKNRDAVYVSELGNVQGSDDVCETDRSRPFAEADLNASQYGVGQAQKRRARRADNLSVESIIGLIGEEETEIERECEGGDIEALSVCSVSNSDVLNSSVLNSVDVNESLHAMSVNSACKNADSSATAVSSGLPNVALFSKCREQGQSKLDTSEETCFFVGDRFRPDTDKFLDKDGFEPKRTADPAGHPHDILRGCEEGVKSQYEQNATSVPMDVMDPDALLFGSESPVLNSQPTDVGFESMATMIQQFRQESASSVQATQPAVLAPHVEIPPEQSVSIERVSVRIVPAESNDEMVNSPRVSSAEAGDVSTLNVSRSFMGGV